VHRDVVDVRLVELRRDHAGDAGHLSGKRLLLQPTDWQDLTDQGGLARHRGIRARQPSGDE